MRYGLGIDVGTAFTAAAVGRAGTLRMVRLTTRSLLLPSVIGLRPDGSLGVGPFGPEPPERSRVTAQLFRRRLGDSTPIEVGPRSCTAGEALAMLVGAVLTQVNRAHGGPPDQVVLTCPAAWGPYRREQLAQVARHAGLPPHQVTLTTEAEAVTTYHLSTRTQAATAPVAVYDVGGSTFDATVIHTFRRRAGRAGNLGTARAAPPIEVLGVPETLEWFGGVDLDEALRQYLDASSDGALSLLDPRSPQDAVVLGQVQEACLRAKIELSQAPSVTVEVPLGSGHRSVTLTRSQLEDRIRPALEAGLPILRRVLDSAGVKAAGLDEILLTGGTAQVPLIRRMLAQDLGRPVLAVPGAQHAAALGAALLATRTGAAVRSGTPQARAL